MKTSDVLPVVSQALTHNFPLLITGAPGIGKSDLVDQSFASLSMPYDLRHPVIEDSTDVKGMPGFDGSLAKFFPFADFDRMLHATSPHGVFIDDLGQSSPSVQAAYMQLILARKLGDKTISPHVRFVAATNRRKDAAGVTNLITPLVSRFTVIEMECDPLAWVKWGIVNKMPVELLAFARFRPDLLNTFDPARAKDITPYACPRSVATLGRWLNAGVTSLEVWKGAAGESFATEFAAFYSMYKSLAGLPDKVIANPQSADIPVKADVLYALTGALAHRANNVNFANICKYGERLGKAGKPEFDVAMVQDCVTRHPELMENAGYIDFATRNSDII